MSSNLPSTSLLHRLWRDYVSSHVRKLSIAMGCMVVAAVTTAAEAWLLQPVFDDVFIARDATMLWLIPLVVVILTLMKGGASYGQAMLMRTVGQRIVADMQLKLYTHLLHSDLALFHDQSSGKLISRFTNDITLMRESLTTALTGVVKEAFTVVCLVGVMLYQSWQLSLVAVLFFPIAVYPILKMGRRMRKLSVNVQEELGQYTAQLDDTFQAVRVIKAYGQEVREAERASGTIERLFQLYSKAFRVKSAASPLMETLAGFAVAGVIWYGGMQVMEGATTPGAFVSFLAAVIMAYKPVKTLAGMHTNLQEGLAAAGRLYDVLDVPPAIVDVVDAKVLQVNLGNVRLSNVSFEYREGIPALSHVSIDVPAGKVAALVGPSGGGKSTLMNLLLRFYDVDHGVITIDGQDIRGVTLASLRDAFALVSQETLLFDDTVRANICYGSPDVSDDEMIAAAKAAAAHEFIQALPKGYDTPIGQHGATLSGGQRQRLAIVRAMLKDAPILLLDEATSALDTASEQHIQQALDTLMKGRTTLVIAHRLSTIQHADVIYVMEQGQVVESGNHEELLARGGIYSELCRKQFG